MRVFQAAVLRENSEIQLDPEATHHVARVLRAQKGEPITLFNGEGGEYRGMISHIDKKSVTVSLSQFFNHETESPLELYLAQGISRGEKMDYTIQKAVELGVKKIIPLLTERCNVKLDEERREKRAQHWRSIIISACEQSGRNRIPELLPVQTLNDWLTQTTADWKFVLAPTAQQKLSELTLQKTAKVILLIGPEGGLSEHEIQRCIQHQFTPLNLGPRILRTETAAVAAITALQFFAGDL